MTCRHVADDQPRLLVDQHHRDCNASGCPGCKPCPDRHCTAPRCPGRHLDDAERLTCARCVGHVRADLAAINTLSTGRLEHEAQHRGVHSEAAMLAGPTADPKGWYRRAARAALAGEALEDAHDELHPLFVLGSWEELWRDVLNHHTEDRLTLTGAIAYLNTQLTYMAQQPEPDFAQFASEVRACRSHLEDVLHDGVREETGAPCPMCGNRALVKRHGPRYQTGARCRACHTETDLSPRDHCPNPWCWTVAPPEPIWESDEDEDRWECPARDCNASYTEHDYRTKVDAIYTLHADALTASQIREVYRVPEGTVRQWANRGKVRKHGRDELGRMLYDVADTLAMRDRTGQESA